MCSTKATENCVEHVKNFDLSPEPGGKPLKCQVGY